MPTPSPVKGGKLPKCKPKARVMYNDIEGFSHLYYDALPASEDHPASQPVAILPTRTKSQAARICKAHNMTKHELRDHFAGIIWNHREIKMEKCWLIADSLISALGLGGEATR